MSKDDSDVIWKILIAVVVIMAFWWWRSDNGRIKRIEELKETVEKYEERIEELERENKSMEEELNYYTKED